MTEEAQFLKYARLCAKLTQGELGKKLGWGSAQFVSNQERGKSSLPNDSIKKFIKVTKCDKGELFKAKISDYAQDLKRFFP